MSHMQKIMYSLPLAYGLVVLIWGTTPLGVQWSAQGFSPFLAALVRVLIAFAILLVCVRVARIAVPFHKPALKIYAAAVLGQGIAMLLIYWSSLYLSSGLVSLIFGFSPLITGFLAWYLYHEKLTLVQCLAVGTGIAGLMVVFSESIQVSAFSSTYSTLALVCMFIACLLFCISNIWVKRLDDEVQIHPLALTIASLGFSMPFYFITVFFSLVWGDVDLVDLHFSWKAMLSTVYLAILGSVIAPYYYFVVLKKSSANLVALITVITPVIALILGASLNAEIVGFKIIAGSVIILLSLLLYQFSTEFLNLFGLRYVSGKYSKYKSATVKADKKDMLQ
jgi:drug/metabolite transporter (DMT)-like permease